MDTSKLDDCLVAANPRATPANLDALLAELKRNAPLPPEIAEKCDMLWEGWNESGLSIEQANFCFAVAALQSADSPQLRKIMTGAVKRLLPPYLTHNPVIRAIGVRDTGMPLSEAARRMHQLMMLKVGLSLFLPTSRRWGIAGAVDGINATLAVTGFGGMGGGLSIPLESVLKEAVLLNPSPDLLKLAGASTNPCDSNRFRTIISRQAVTPIDDAMMQLMAQSGCASHLAGDAFAKYWSAATPAAGATGERRSCDGRSLKEIDLLLSAEEKAAAGKLTDDEAAKFRTFFERLKAESARRDGKLLGLIVGKISERANASQMETMFAPLLNKAPFWPENPAMASLPSLEVWGELPSKTLDQIAAVTAMSFPEEYLAACALRLPLKALNSICEQVSFETLLDTVKRFRGCSADLMLWIWKNRKKHQSDQLLALVNLENTVRILGSEDPPKAWGAARRELRAMLLDKEDFQTRLIEGAGDNPSLFSAILQSALFLSSGERQSLMVKLARLSDNFRLHLESGAGQKILTAGIGKQEPVAAPVNEPSYTSVKSHKALMDELDDIINVQVPENREALRVARAHGDFRENSEYDAAKERRNHLSRRRSELERELANIQPVIMAQVKVDKTAVIGSVIEIEFNDGAKEKHYLLGAWDGQPERNFLSYRTVLGKAVLNRAIGETFDAPGGRKGKLVSVSALPAELIAELDA